jgi:hypothetical protein
VTDRVSARVRVCATHIDECDCRNKARKYPTVSTYDLGRMDGWICAYCYQPVARELAYAGNYYLEPVCEHVHPRSKGGSNDLDNLLLACGRCNNRKSNRLLVEWVLYEQQKGRLQELPGLRAIALEMAVVERVAHDDGPTYIGDVMREMGLR